MERKDRIDDRDTGFVERLIHVNRVAKVVKRGRRFSFSALVVVGDGEGQVGAGLGKAREVPAAIRKGGAIARKNLIEVPMIDGTIPYKIVSKFGGAKVMLKPAAPGTGVIASGGVRAAMEAAGIRDVVTKSMGSSNPINVVRATMLALSQLKDPKQEVARRKAVAAGGEEPGV
ncbi:MAG: 30S ribosomal protein S5 [Dehalococcoidia bacterium DG_18]|jgi:small subunit ribosomal protein S5|nr:MAG: 30S ribosomal protein S5 [Dehalococcoidia bacterium DG_18]